MAMTVGTKIEGPLTKVGYFHFGREWLIRLEPYASRWRTGAETIFRTP